jgi:hypothetical protein
MVNGENVIAMSGAKKQSRKINAVIAGLTRNPHLAGDAETSSA